MQRTGIEWTHWSVNALKMQMPDGTVVNACVHKSRGCEHCYAEALVRRFWKKEFGEFPGYTPSLLKLGTPVLVEKELEAVLRLSERIARGKSDPKENRLFWHDMTDEYLDFWPDEMLDKIWAVRALTPNLIHQVLTKRPERMYGYLTTDPQEAILERLDAGSGSSEEYFQFWEEYGERYTDFKNDAWPLRNVWLGVSCEDQKTADERIPWLLKTPAAVRWISYEPALGPVDFVEATYQAECPDCKGQREITDYEHELHPRNTGDAEDETWCPTCTDAGEPKLWGLDQIICGGESGPGARPCDIQWIRNVRDQCRLAGIACFVKQLGRFVMADPAEFPMRDNEWLDPDGDFQGPVLNDKKGGDWSEWPVDLRIRQFPREVAE